MQPILWQWGNWMIGSYAVMMTLGLLAATLIVLGEARRRHIRSGIVLDALLAAVTVGILAARLGYVLINWVYFQDHSGEILQLWQGGLNWQIGFIGGSIAAWLLAQRDPAPWRIMDILATGAALGVCFGWLGSYLTATAFGKELFPNDPFFFLAIDAPDWYGSQNPRWPTQLLGALWAGLLFISLWIISRRDWPNGARYWLFIGAYSLGAFLIGFTRGEDLPRLYGLRSDQVLDAALALIGLWQVVRLRRSRSRQMLLSSDQ